MIHSYLTELYSRTNIIITAYIVVILIVTQYISELLIFLLNPVLEIHNDWYNFMLQHIISNTFETYDTDSLQFSIHDHAVEYIPSCEITIRNNILNATIAIITIHTSILIMAVIILYHCALCTIPSLFAFEKKKYIWTLVYYMALFVFSVVLTHHLWTHIFLNFALHNYSEFNYYEFDVDFDMHYYIHKYILANYITFISLFIIHRYKITSLKTIVLILILLYIMQTINILEICYYIIIIVTYYEINTILYIIHYKLNNLYKLVL
jgi:hypothetical protein